MAPISVILLESIHTGVRSGVVRVNSQLLIGTCGWDHGHWCGPFYDPDLPTDWRLTYYANLLRAVLVPELTGVKVDATLAASWLEDTDEGFKFVIEISAELVDLLPHRPVSLNRWLEGIRLLAGQVAAVLVRPSPASRSPGPAALEQFCNALSPVPVCVEPSDHPGGRGVCGVVWYPSKQVAPTVGDYLVALSDVGDPKGLRQLIEWFIEQNLVGAALFMTDRTRGFEHAQQARLIAEMLGV